MNNMNWNYPTTIWFGLDRSKEIQLACNSLGMKNPLIVTDPGLLKTNIIETINSSLTSKTNIFSDVQGNPTGKNVEEGVKTFNQNNHDGVIAIGGGSGMDVGKGIAFLAEQTRPLWDFEDIGDWWTRADSSKIKPIIAIPTTAGTGSEVTPISIITVGEEEKKGVSSSIILPDIAILDPDLTIGLPAHTTAATGIDAMVHAIEAYTSSNKNNNPISKMLAIEALKLLSGSIEKAVFDGSNIEARGNMLIGAMLAGKAFANSPVAAVHALAYPIGGTFHVSHGLSNSLVLPYVLRFNSVDAQTTKNYAELAPFIFPDIDTAKGNQAVCKEFIDRLEDLSQKIGLPQRLREVNIPKEACKKMASDAMKQTRLLVNNPREVTENDALNIYESAW